MCPNPINFGSLVLSFVLLFVFILLLLLLRLVVNWLLWSFWNVRLAVSRVKWVNLLVCLCMESAYGDKYRLETWRYSFYFFISSPPVVCASSQRNLFFCFLMPHSIQFGIRVVCMCVCERVTRVSVRHRKIYCFWPQPTVEMPYGLTQPIWQRSNCFIPDERKPCCRRRCCYCCHKTILHFSMVWHFVCMCVCFFPLVFVHFVTARG